MNKKWISQVNLDELKIEILLNIGYEDLLETVILLQDILFNWIAKCIRVSTTFPS